MSLNSRNKLPEPYQSWQETPPESAEETLDGMEMIRQGIYEGIITTDDQLHLALGTLSPFLHRISHDPCYDHVPDAFARIEMNDRLTELYRTLHARDRIAQPLPINEDTESILWRIGRIRGWAKNFCVKGSTRGVQDTIKALPYEFSPGVPVTSAHFSFPPEEIAALQRKGGIAEAKKMLKAIQQREKKGLPAHIQRKQLDGFLQNRGLTHADLVKAPKVEEAV